jgi:hypothetical protein
MKVAMSGCAQAPPTGAESTLYTCTTAGVGFTALAIGAAGAEDTAMRA